MTRTEPRIIRKSTNTEARGPEACFGRSGFEGPGNADAAALESGSNMAIDGTRSASKVNTPPIDTRRRKLASAQRAHKLEAVWEARKSPEAAGLMISASHPSNKESPHSRNTKPTPNSTAGSQRALRSVPK